jgi:hypothetical protein
VLVRVDDVFLAVFLGVYREAVRVDLLLGLAPELQGVCLLRALLAEVLVLAIVAGALLRPPVCASLGPLDEGLEERDAGCDDDEVAFDAVQGDTVSGLGLGRMGEDGCDTYDVQYKGSHKSSLMRQLVLIIEIAPCSVRQLTAGIWASEGWHACGLHNTDTSRPM